MSFQAHNSSSFMDFLYKWQSWAHLVALRCSFPSPHSFSSLFQPMLLWSTMPPTSVRISVVRPLGVFISYLTTSQQVFFQVSPLSSFLSLYLHTLHDPVIFIFVFDMSKSKVDNLYSGSKRSRSLL